MRAAKTSSKFRFLLAHCLMLICVIFFPFALVKIVCLFCPVGPEWTCVIARITGFGGSWESAFQTILTLFIIFTRVDRQPSNIQIASLVASFVMITQTAIADFLSPKQPMRLRDELKPQLPTFPCSCPMGSSKCFL